MKYNFGSFTSAALPSIRNHCNAVINKYPEYATSSQINDLFLNNVGRFLTSIGICMDKGCIPSERMIDSYIRTLKRMRDEEYMKNCLINVDSAGYQIQCGYLSRENIPRFIDLYYDRFVNNGYNMFDKAFTLDLAPGFSNCPYKSWLDLENLNRHSYEKASQLNPEIRNKMIYIHHFRTPKLYSIYKNMINDGLIDGFKHFGTGGLVSMSSNKVLPPCVMYVVPFIDIIRHCKKNGINNFTFHVLGETEFKSILSHCMFERHIKKVHDIDVTITYDSSTIFKVLGMGRYTYYLDENKSIRKLSLRSDVLHCLHKNSSKTNSELFYEIINNSVTPYGMKHVDNNNEPLYDKDGKFHKIFYTYGIFQMFRLFKEVQDLCYDIVDKIYPYYGESEFCDLLYFNQLFENQLIQFNGNRDSKVIDNRVNVMINSLDLIKSLDENYCQYLVDNFMIFEQNQELPDR